MKIDNDSATSVHGIVMPAQYVAVCQSCQYENVMDRQYAQAECGHCKETFRIKWEANEETAIAELIEAAKDIRDNPGTDAHGTVGFCTIENPKLERLRVALDPFTAE